jgi:hypothetical protein
MVYIGHSLRPLFKRSSKMTRNRRIFAHTLSSLMINLWFLLFIHALAFSQPIIIDHTCTDLTNVPEYRINQAKAKFRISYGHTSHGSQIVTGMNLLKGQAGSLYWFDRNGTDSGLSFHDCKPSGDLGNPDRVTWASRTRELLDAPGNDRNMIMWSWCGQVSSASEEDINTYLGLMNQLEQEYPEVTFVYMTGHLDGTSEGGNLHLRNNQIRNYCISNGKILFDFADIESYDPSGSYFLNRGANDVCGYDGGNWADEWCSAHPGECAQCSCAHSRCLNCQLKGKAFWWMMARIAGWVPDGGVSIDIKANGQDGPLIISRDTPVSITVSLNPGSYDGPEVDWWIIAYVESSWYSFIFPTGWSCGINLCGQAPLFDLSPFEILNAPLPRGDYALFFAVDDNMDAIPDGTWLDALEIQVQ